MRQRSPQIFVDERMLDHQPGPGHPERPQRLQAVLNRLHEELPQVPRQAAPPATREMVERVHAPAYVESILALKGRSARLDADTIVSPQTVDAAFIAAGQAVAAASFAFDQRTSTFALVRPPGHHAEGHRGMGFCFFNNIAVAAAEILATTEVERVLIVDWDVHHGNGTQEIFYERGDVFFFSTHQSPLYPGTGDAAEAGAGPGLGATLNRPLPAGTGDEELLEVFQSSLIPAARDFAPELILVSAGFDAHRLDPIGGMRVSAAGFGALTDLVAELAQECCQGRLALILEGGYDLEGLSTSVVACLQSLIQRR